MISENFLLVAKLPNKIQKKYWDEKEIAFVTFNAILKAESKLNVKELMFIIHVFELVKACAEQ